MEVVGLSIDRLAIVGRMKVNREKDIDYTTGELIPKVVRMLKCDRDYYNRRIKVLHDDFWLKVQGRRDYKSHIYDYIFDVGKHCVVQIGDDRGKGSNFRVEWNPNKVTSDEDYFIKELLQSCKQLRFTRIDLALDVKEDLADWNIVNFSDRKTGKEHKRSERLETRYIGTENADWQTCIYNKEADLRRKGEVIGEVRWRIEDRIRRDKAEKWEEHDWFSGIKLEKGKSGYKEVDAVDWSKVDLKANEKAQLIACIVQPSLLNEFSKPTQIKIKKQLDEVAYFENLQSEVFVNRLVKEKMSPTMYEIEETLRKLLKLENVKKKSTKTDEETKRLIERDNIAMQLVYDKHGKKETEQKTEQTPA